MPVSDRSFEGRFVRLIDLKRWGDDTVVGWLEDDFHHFGLTLVHDGHVVKEVRGNAARHPWSTCPGAFEPLQELVGKPLTGRCSDVGKLINMRSQCTHLFDLAGLLLAHAFHGRDHRFYRGTVEKEGPADEDLRRAVLHQDGGEVMSWQLRGADSIIGPDPYGGHSTDRGFREWTEGMECEQAEWASVLRRIVFVAQGRVYDYSDVGIAADMGIPAVCHTYQPQFAKVATRIRGHQIRHDDNQDDMLALRQTKP